MEDSPCILIEFDNISQSISDQLAALLTECEFEGFEEEDGILKAYVRKENYDRRAVEDIAGKLKLAFSVNEIRGNNWNQAWEESFHPVIMGRDLAIRASFHSRVKSAQNEIIITPKMSFGTGHHATTYLMLEQMIRTDLMGKRVLDFGTGTGILAILGEKLGAGEILAIEIDDLALENARENIAINNCRKILLQKSCSPESSGSFDIVLANITRNIILENLGLFSSMLRSGGSIMISGILAEDEEAILEKSEALRLATNFIAQRDNWLLMNLLRI